MRVNNAACVSLGVTEGEDVRDGVNPSSAHLLSICAINISSGCLSVVGWPLKGRLKRLCVMDAL